MGAAAAKAATVTAAEARREAAARAAAQPAPARAAANAQGCTKGAIRIKVHAREMRRSKGERASSRARKEEQGGQC